MRVEITGPDRTVLLELETTVRWAASVSGNRPEASFTLPRHSPAWGETLDDRGGWVARIRTPRGSLTVITNRPETDARGMHFQGLHVSYWLEQPVQMERAFHSALAGHVVRAVFRDAILGNERSPLKLGSVLMAPPLVDIEISGQTVLDVLTELRNQTGHEWMLDDTALTFSWGPREGRSHEHWIVDDGALFERVQHGSLLDEPAQVIEIEPDGGRYTSINPNAPIYWPRSEVVRL